MSQWLADITTVKQLDHFLSLMWQGYADGQLNDDEVQELTGGASLRRSMLLEARERRMPPARTYFPQRPKSEQSRREAASGARCPIRWARKRRLGDMAALPPFVRDCFTEGERAVLYIVASDCRQHGSCRSSVKEIGDRAGVGVSTVRNALRRARRLGLVDVTERPQWRAKHLPNLVKIVCRRWLAWLQKFRPNLGLRFYPIGFKKAASSGTFGHKKRSGQPSYSRTDGPSGRFQRFAGRKPPSG
ncbi:hypothetical protein P3C33_27815 [Mesorhizobium sp. P16.1]|uniref:hypothetical protein n=1 Tax=unclassified Mesorhizobium TaxID=325217 RepID=UPI0021A90CF8|nr:MULTISPECIES: hypothetical protein [unclassified Mesorhizobium]MCT2580901.1 hypothetical protein [Mesorhizobium sp. P13.3]MDF3169960.1 hypothetical protein [Mesorhizobium sp. P16.1]MDF3181414.1 hypothetical protein [Mesorhizobium sp. P17.1]MDF3186919.1 hypothetical protein [Mesorhizobium sp. ICCV3110.1]